MRAFWLGFCLHRTYPVSDFGVGVFVLFFRQYRAIPGRGLWCVFLGTGFAFIQPFVAGVRDVGVCVGLRFGFTPQIVAGVGVYVFVCVRRLYLAISYWGVLSGRVRFSSGFGCTLPFLAGVLGCVYLCAWFASTPPILAGVRCVCVLVRILAFSPPHPG